MYRAKTITLSVYMWYHLILCLTSSYSSSAETVRNFFFFGNICLCCVVVLVFFFFVLFIFFVFVLLHSSYSLTHQSHTIWTFLFCLCFYPSNIQWLLRFDTSSSFIASFNFSHFFIRLTNTTRLISIFCCWRFFSIVNRFIDKNEIILIITDFFLFIIIFKWEIQSTHSILSASSES